MERNPSSLLPGINHAGRSVFEQKACRFEVAGRGSRVQWQDLGRIRSQGVDRRPAFNQQSSGFGLAEKTGEMQCRETVCRSRVEGGTVANAFLQALDTAKRSGFENIKRLFPVGDQFRQVAAAPIEGMHEQADAIRAVSLRSGGILFQKSPKAVGIASLHEFEGAMEVW